MKINHLITIFSIFSIAAVAAVAASSCPSEKPEDNKPVEITFSAALSLQDALKNAGAQYQKN